MTIYRYVLKLVKALATPAKLYLINSIVIFIKIHDWPPQQPLARANSNPLTWSLIDFHGGILVRVVEPAAFVGEVGGDAKLTGAGLS